jgi:phosphoribosylanthranilate isomerase
VFVQIYGITTVEDARAVDALGPDSIGIVLDEGFAAWDKLDVATAKAVASAVKRSKLVVASLTPACDGIVATYETLRPAIVHLARANDMTAAALEEVRGRVAPAELMATVPVSDAQSTIALARRLSPYVDYLQLDTVHPDTGLVGATGAVHDWHISAAVVGAVDIPVLLSGGLGPDNVAEAIRQVRPAGVDSETRTSRDDDRLRKDLAKVEAFITAARTTESH